MRIMAKQTMMMVVLFTLEGTTPWVFNWGLNSAYHGSTVVVPLLQHHR
jgi:hypothetical protein